MRHEEMQKPPVVRIMSTAPIHPLNVLADWHIFASCRPVRLSDMVAKPWRLLQYYVKVIQSTPGLTNTIKSMDRSGRHESMCGLEANGNHRFISIEAAAAVGAWYVITRPSCELVNVHWCYIHGQALPFQNLSANLPPAAGSLPSCQHHFLAAYPSYAVSTLWTCTMRSTRRQE